MTELKTPEKNNLKNTVGGLAAFTAAAVLSLSAAQPATAEYYIYGEGSRVSRTRECSKEDVLNLNYGFTANRERSRDCTTTKYDLIDNLGTKAGILHLYNNRLVLTPLNRNLRIRITNANIYRVSDQKLVSEFRFGTGDEIILGLDNLSDQIPLGIQEGQYLSISLEILGKDNNNTNQRNRYHRRYDQ